MDVIWEVLCCQ